jgi:protoheme IX farnesyltransferase
MGAGPSHVGPLSPAVELGGVALFALLFFWQVPHFLAIALCRGEDYASAGMKMAPADRSARVAKLRTLAYTLLAVCSTFGVRGLVGTAYCPAACVLGALYLGLAAYGLVAREDKPWARALFGGSIVYLLGVFAAMLLDRATEWGAG